jgi:HrpA-like RNA helicase
MLIRLGALTEEEETITSLGRHLAAFPIAPRFAKMLVLGHQVRLFRARCAVRARLALRCRPLCRAPPRFCPADGLQLNARSDSCVRARLSPALMAGCRWVAQGGCLPYVLSIVAALSVENPIVFDRADANSFSAGKADAGSDSDADSALEEDSAEQVSSIQNFGQQSCVPCA